MRAALQELLGEPFVKIRPIFLLNLATRRKRELDAWNEKLRLAVEFDGPQVSKRNAINHAENKPASNAITFLIKLCLCAHLFTQCAGPLPHL
jgi:hypothetical protein